jgi:hypothetical protein
MRSGLLITGIVLLIIGGGLAAALSSDYNTCQSAVGQLYQLLGGQDCNAIYAEFGFGIFLAIIGFILLVLGAVLSPPRPVTPPTPQVIYVQQPPSYSQPGPVSQPYAGASQPAPPPPPPPTWAPAPPPPPTPAAERFCTSCGAGNLRASAFCQKCGKPLPPPP